MALWWLWVALCPKLGAWGVGRGETVAPAAKGGGTAEWAGRNRKEEAKAKVPARVINRAQKSLPETNFSDESKDGKNASALHSGRRERRELCI
jgi:hypothetical protein